MRRSEDMKRARAAAIVFRSTHRGRMHHVAESKLIKRAPPTWGSEFSGNFFRSRLVPVDVRGVVRYWLIVFALTLSALLPALRVLHAQQEPTGLPTFRVEVELVNVYCTVRDKKGRLVTDLTKEDFILKEDGKTREILYFSKVTDLPLTLALLIDVSPSQRRLIETEKAAAAAFFRQVLRPKDQACLISFGPDVELHQDFTNSARFLSLALEDLEVRGSPTGILPPPVPTASKPKGTVLYDAVWVTARDKLLQEVGRKAMILITDGVDFGSIVDLKEAIREAHRADAVIYAIYYFDPEAYRTPTGWLYRPSDSALKKMIRETGGRIFRVSKKWPLDRIFQEIQAELRSQYALGFIPGYKKKDGSYHRIEVKTKRRGLKVTARRGYYALPTEPE